MLDQSTTRTIYGIEDEQFVLSPLPSNTIKVIITDEPTEGRISYKMNLNGVLQGRILDYLTIGPDLKEEQILNILNNQNKRSLEIYIPRWINQNIAFEVNNRLAKMHIKYREQFVE